MGFEPITEVLQENPAFRIPIFLTMKYMKSMKGQSRCNVLTFMPLPYYIKNGIQFHNKQNSKAGADIWSLPADAWCGVTKHPARTFSEA